jgi:hypothetical protein
MRSPKINSFAMLLMDRAFARIVNLWPADSRDWARAMHAEFQQTTNAGEKLSWLLGGAMSLTSAWTQRLAFGPRKIREAAAQKPVKKPGVLAFSLMAIALASLALPGMLRGIETVWATWNARAAALSPAQLERMGREAEQNHDAKMLAFVAERLVHTEKSSQYFADAAVAMDPNLTWIYFERPNYLYRVHPSAEDALRRARILEKWDPQNAVPYLMEASVAFDRYEETWSHETSDVRKSTEDRAAELSNDPAWAVPMAKAFAASRYDDYVRRNLELNIAVIRGHHIDRPVDLLIAAGSAELPNLLAVQVYSAGLLRSGNASAQAGNLEVARENYWRVADFAGIMRGEPSVSGYTITKLIADNLAKKSFEKLRLSADAGSGSRELSRFADYQLGAIKNDRDSISESNQSNLQQRQSASFSSVTIHLASEAIAVSAILSLGSFICFALGMGSSPRIGKYVCRNARIAPFVLVGSMAVFYTNYLPYFAAFRTSSPDDINRAAQALNGLLYVPMYFAYYARGPRYFWTGVIIVGTISVMLLLARMAFRSRMEGAEA